MPRDVQAATEMVITDVEALKVISDPLRIEILELVQQRPRAHLDRQGDRALARAPARRSSITIST